MIFSMLCCIVAGWGLCISCAHLVFVPPLTHCLVLIPQHYPHINRLVHKVLSDFGEAALAGVKAIFDGYILPMNPNESARAHVYLHNNIFFSRAVDTGLDTFKIIQGDAAAKKSASRDCCNMGLLHRLDIPGLHTLATVLVEYLGTRIICQSVVPGILHGEKSHKLLYGAVETLSALQCDDEMHDLLESTIGEGCMIATRKIPKHPLSDEVSIFFCHVCFVHIMCSLF